MSAWVSVRRARRGTSDIPSWSSSYTSQGCSSCPAGRRASGELDERDDVIPLALHVDYWDYIGWKDKFAQPKFTARQKGYAKADGRSSVYTPQMVVGGTARRGRHPAQGRQVDRSRRTGTAQPGDAWRSRAVTGCSSITAESDTPVGQAVIYLVRYEPRPRGQDQAGRECRPHDRLHPYRHRLGRGRALVRERHVRGRRADRSEQSRPSCIVQERRVTGPILAAVALALTARLAFGFPAAVDPEPLLGIALDPGLQRACRRPHHLHRIAMCDRRVEIASKLTPSGWRIPKNGTMSAPVLAGRSRPLR